MILVWVGTSEGFVPLTLFTFARVQLGEACEVTRS